jgi:hypothetical protein
MAFVIALQMQQQVGTNLLFPEFDRHQDEDHMAELGRWTDRGIFYVRDSI